MPDQYSLLKAIQVIPNQESLRNRHNQERPGTKETRQLNVAWYWFGICDQRAVLTENVNNKQNWL